ncbi:DUF6282 family protein [Natronorubrum sp. FCH18a]|uniref:DUF6282 family protein n=1 Tax=Natronorubrum sp. FCH18a TaxID=3447018 RepID=UPI003F514F3F
MRIDGAIDIHVHAEPSLWDRKHDIIELAERVEAAGMGGFLVKSHFGNSFQAATIAAAAVPDVDIYSSVALNTFVGGFNPSAVELAVETGASVVWLPTFSAANFDTSHRNFPFSGQHLVATDDDGTVKPDIVSVIETIAAADRDVILGNGHLDREETFAILDLIEERGYDIPYLITHADSAFMGLSTEDQVELADRGAYIEKCYLPVVKDDIGIPEMTRSIEAIGVDQCLLSTDHGQPDNASPPDAFRTFVDELRAQGISDADLEHMYRDLPRALLAEPY